MVRIDMRARFFLLLLIAVSSGLPACKAPENLASVNVMVDFGPAGKPQVNKEVKLPVRSTAFEALREAFPVVTSGR